MSANNDTPAPMVELCFAAPIFVDGLSEMTAVGPVTHLVFTALQKIDGEGMRRVVQARLTVPTDQLKAIGHAMLAGHVKVGCPTDEAGEPVKLQGAVTDESEIPANLEYKQTPENVWEATSIILFAIADCLRQRGLITASEIRETTDAALDLRQRQIGDGLPGPGIYGTGNPPLDWNNFSTIREMVEVFCKEQAAQEAGLGSSSGPHLSVLQGGKSGSEEGET
ncbi:MAG: hypothetical protein ACLPX7_02540 [Xanthobacteraceae bacterium]